MSIAKRNRAIRKSIGIGTVIAAFAFALFFFALTAQNGLPEYAPGVDRNTVRVAFTDVGSLRVGDDARIANVRAGFVQDIRLDGTNPIVTLKLDDNRAVYADAAARIRDRSVLGQKYVDLYPGTEAAGTLGENGIIAAEQTEDVKELAVLLNVFDQPTRDGLGSTLREVGGGLTGRSDDLAEGFDSLQPVLNGLGTVTGSLAGERDDLAALLSTADQLGRSFVGRQEQVGEVVGNVGRTFAALNADGGQPLSATLQKAPDAFVETRSALEALNAPLASTAVAMRDIQPGAESLGRSTDTVRGTLRDAPAPLYKVPTFTDAADPALESLQPTFEEIEPVTEQLRATFDRAETPLKVIAPYSPEVFRFFTNMSSALGQGDGDGNWLRVLLHFNSQTVNQTPLQDPTRSRDPYPAPGTVHKDQQRSVIAEETGR